MQPVDSRQQQLDIQDIVEIASTATDQELDIGRLLKRMVVELSLPTTRYMVFGNTLFIINQADGRNGFMRALNADTAENFLNHCIKFADSAYLLGFDNLLTEFETPSFLQVFRVISQNPPREEMGYAVARSGDNKLQVLFKLGPEREGVPR